MVDKNQQPKTEITTQLRNDNETSKQLELQVQDLDEASTNLISSRQAKSKGKGKPKWWKQVAGQKATKGQRACLERMTKLGFVLEKLPGPFAYTGEYVDLDRLFTRNNIENSKAIPQNEKALPPLVAEIGFGRGDNIFWTAMKNPQYRYLGAELYKPGLCHLLKYVEDSIFGDAPANCSRLWKENENEITINESKAAQTAASRIESHEQQAPLELKPDTTNEPTKTEDCVCTVPHLSNNIRVYGGDGMKLLKCLPPVSLSTISITFPDPFACSSNEKWRILQVESIQEFERVLQPRNQTAEHQSAVDLDHLQSLPLHGRFFLATDDVNFDRWTRELFQKRAAQLLKEKRIYKCPEEQETSKRQPSFSWKEIVGSEMPCRSLWLPVISQYEAKGLAEGRSTLLQCWELHCKENPLV